MTNDTTLHEQGAADQEAAIAATILTPTADSAPAEPVEPPAPSFDDLGLHSDVRQALEDMGYFTPTPVQTAVYKVASEGKDLLVQSRTGTGKTTAFGLPVINNLIPTHRAPQAMVLCPTRELALQVARELTQIGKHRGVLVETLYGGAPIGKQISALRDGVHVIVGTPGRVLDHIGRRTLDCKTITTFILDECDEMLSMGFLEDIERVMSHLPEKKQTMLFSATMPEEVQRYARRHMKAPEQISLSRDSISVSDIHHAYYIVSGIARSRDLLKILFAENPESAIIFCNMRDETTMVAKFLQKQGLDAEPLSSDLSQADRERVMNRMKAKNLRFLCATDVAARGIDISNLSHVINYSVPEQPEIYVHRTGRTGRAGKKGTALSMVGPRELGNFRYVRLTFGIKPEERLLPKDDIFEGKLKVALPPVGVPQPPDPVQILIRGVTGTPSELERQIFEKLLATSNGKRVLAQLVADKLDKLSTRSKPRRPSPSVAAHGEADGVGAPQHAPGGERPERGEDRDRPRGDFERPRRFDGERGGDRPPRDGERRQWRDRDGGGSGSGGGGERRFDRDRGDRPSGDRPDRGAPPFGDRPETDRGEYANRHASDRPGRDDRGGRFGRDRGRGDRDRSSGGSSDHPQPERIEPPVVETAVNGESAPSLLVADAPVVETRGDRDRNRGRGRDRDRDRDRDRGERRDASPPPAPTFVEVGTEATPPVETEVVAKVDDVARAALERADRGERKAKRDKKEPAGEAREFWETWADEKTTREPAAEAAEAIVSTTQEASPAARASETAPRGRDRGRGRDRSRAPTAGGDKKPRGRADKVVVSDDKPARTKRAEPAAAAASAEGQTRVFVSLGKTHGVSADDLRELLAGPIGGDKARIGSVSLRDSHAHVRVPEELVDQIITAVNGTQHNDHAVTVERSRA